MNGIWFLIAGLVLSVLALFIMGCCKAADRYDRDAGMK